MSSEMLPSPRRVAIEEQNAEQRRAALERLNAEAATADAARAREIMLQGRLIAEALEAAKAPFEEAWLAGKASVLAARRLGRLLLDLPNIPRRNPGSTGSIPSQRGMVMRELGLSTTSLNRLTKLAQASDPDFQRYIQSREQIPSVNGALRCVHPATANLRSQPNRMTIRRAQAGIKTPDSPSLDEAYSLIVRALGHLSAQSTKVGYGSIRKDLGLAVDHLYAAEDLLKPYRAGYDGTGRKAA